MKVEEVLEDLVLILILLFFLLAARVRKDLHEGRNRDALVLLLLAGARLVPVLFEV